MAAGELKGGALHGVGTLVIDGTRFQGRWAGGVCDGLGKATLRDGSDYDGCAARGHACEPCGLHRACSTRAATPPQLAVSSLLLRKHMRDRSCMHALPP